jgi:AraC-like DNA-binding protein
MRSSEARPGDRPTAARVNGAVSCPEHASPAQGLWRTLLAGPGGTLTDAFENVERSPQVDRLLRHPRRHLLSARVTLAAEEGEGYWELTRIRNELYVIIADFAYEDARLELVPGDGLVQFNFRISGDLTYGVGQPGPLRFNRPSLHVWRQPQGIDMREWTAPGSHERVVSISVRPEFLVDHIFSTCNETPAPLRHFVSPSQEHIAYCEVPLTAQMVDLTTRLLENAYTGALALTYTEALALELLCVAVGNLCSSPDLLSAQYSERELRGLRQAREILMKQLAPPPTLRALSRSVGLSEKALTRGFKAVYGETVFDFSLRCRMQHALTLLRDRRWSVDRVSEVVGYAHPTSFATAFRRHFGMRPIDVRPAKVRAARSIRT